MRKIFSAALALVCIWFATPSWGACNLYTTTNSSAGYIDGSGVVQNASSYLATDYIAVNSSTEYTVYIKQNAAISGHGVRIAFYDTNKQFISPRLGGDAPSAGQYIYNLTSPANAKYIRMSTSYGNVVDRTIVQGRYTVDTIPTNMSQCATCDGTVVNYTSATGTGVQNGTPTPTNPIEPTFYTQGNMVLRKVGNVADSYDASTGKITRRVGVAVLDGTERWGSHASNAGWFQLSSDIFPTDVNTDALSTHYRQYTHNPSSMANQDILFGRPDSSTGRVVIRDAINFPDVGLADDFKSWLAQQYAAGTPVTVYYPLKTETTEDWPASYCETPIKIATTKYNETAFSPLNTALANAISVVDSVVSNTITQAGRIATLQAQKQTRPNDIADDNEKCPAGKKCLLVEDASGVPHWYEIVERYSRLPEGYTELQYIESTGTQYIDTGITLGGGTNYKNTDIKLEYDAVINQGTRWQVSGTLGSAGIFIGVNPENNIAYNAGQTPDIVSDVTNPYVRCLWINDAPNGRVTVKNMITGVNILDATYTPAIKTSQINILLFNYSLAGGSASNNYMYGKMYGAKIYNNGTLIRNFVPAKDAGGVVGMYDTVSGTFFTNQGEGSFIAGDPVAE